MDDLSPRGSLRDRILNDLRITVKQLYHEAVNKELGTGNKTYLCITLIKNLDEALRHGLKQLHLGYWKVLERLLHKQTLDAVEQLSAYGASNDALAEYDSLTKGRAWVALSLNDDSLISYIECLAQDPVLDKHYESWSILRNSDCCNRLLSVLSGLESISFTFDMEYFNKPPRICDFHYKNIECEGEPKSLIFSSASPVDSGVIMPDSSSDIEQTEIDFINGNVPESVVLRKRKKSAKRHVSFHEDIICKSPDKCRKLKWDCENQRYSWSGEELNMEPQFMISTPIKAKPQKLDLKDRGVPEGQEAPCSLETFAHIKQTQKSTIVKRFLQSIKNQTKMKPLSCKYRRRSGLGPDMKPLIFSTVSWETVQVLNSEIDLEIEANIPKSWQYSKNAIYTTLERNITENNEVVVKMYHLRDYLCILTDCNIYLYNKCIFRVVQYQNIQRIIIFPGGEVFQLLEGDNWLRLVGSSLDATNEMMGRIEWCMRRRGLLPPDFRVLNMGDFNWLKRRLIEKAVLHESEELMYYGAVRLERDDLTDATQPCVLRGALMYRDMRQGDSWLPGDFQLKGGVMYLLEQDSQPKLAINLSSNCKSCCRIFDPQRPHTFQLTLVDGDTEFHSQNNCFYEDSWLKSRLGSPVSDAGRVLDGVRAKLSHWFGSGRAEPCVVQFAASDELQLSEWLQAIIQASCGESCEDATKDHLTDLTLLSTKDSLLLVTESLIPTPALDIVSCAQISDIGSLKISLHTTDVFAIVEFTCMEAGSTSGDWFLYFGSRLQLSRFQMLLERRWRHSVPFPLELLHDQRVLARCRAMQARAQAHF